MCVCGHVGMAGHHSHSAATASNLIRVARSRQRRKHEIVCAASRMLGTSCRCSPSTSTREYTRAGSIINLPWCTCRHARRRLCAHTFSVSMRTSDRPPYLSVRCSVHIYVPCGGCCACAERLEMRSHVSLWSLLIPMRRCVWRK